MTILLTPTESWSTGVGFRSAPTFRASTGLAASALTAKSAEAQFVCLAQPSFTKEAITALVDKSLVRPLGVVSDGLACFIVTARTGIHDRIVVSAGKTSAAYARFNAVSTAQSSLNTAMSGAHHSIKFAKYAHRNLAEFQYRFNRRFDRCAIFARLARVACGASPQTRRLIRAAEVGC